MTTWLLAERWPKRNIGWWKEKMPTKRLKIDMDELCWALEDRSSESSWVLDTETGDLLLISDAIVDDDLPVPRTQKEEDDTGRFLWIEPEESRVAFRDMEDFVATVSSAQLRDLLDVAITGKGAFRRFKDVLARSPAELERWFGFRQQRLGIRAREWLAGNEIEPVE